MAGIGRDFVEQTKYRHLGVSDQGQGIRQPPLELEVAGDLQPIPLPRPRDIEVPPLQLREAIETRRSIRRFSREPLSREELAFLLWCTQGVRELLPGSATLRNVPSAGARHALETYLLINRVREQPPGLYRYWASRHALLQMNVSPDLGDRLAAACLGQSFVKSSAATFLWVAVPDRMAWRYGQRGYRYLYLDAGHVCQNLYLAAETIGCGVCAVGAFDDDAVDRVLGLDGERLFTIYLAAVGKR